MCSNNNSNNNNNFFWLSRFGIRTFRPKPEAAFASSLDDVAAALHPQDCNVMDV
jgi:hypothetical protein